MRRTGYGLLILLCGMLFGVRGALAQFEYIFSEGTGSEITGADTTLWEGNRAGAGWGGSPIYSHLDDAVEIGFTFDFTDSSYGRATIGTAGMIRFGEADATSTDNNFAQAGVGRMVAPFWDEMRISGGSGGSCNLSKVSYMTTGSSPNRIFVVLYDSVALGPGGDGFFNSATFQVRLYEGSGKIEFWYDDIDGTAAACSQWGGGGSLTSTSATIGIARDNSTYLSVTPGGNGASVSSTESNNSVDIVANPFSSGTLYTFCPGGVIGDVAEGGTANMADRDTLLVGVQVINRESQDFRPFRFFNQCATDFTYTITGPNASDYSITPANGSFGVDGNTPTLTFTPTGIDVRYATLQVEDNAGQVVRSYTLAGEGTPRAQYVGNIAQGGTPTVADGDIFFQGFKQENNTSVDYTPLTVNAVGSLPPNVPITYTLTDPTGQFSIDRTFESVPPGGSSTPVITFAPVAHVNIHEATLEVNAEGEIRRFLLQIFSSGAGARFFIDKQPFGAGTALFRNVSKCVGVETEVIAITVESIGDEPFELQSNDAFRTNPIIQQGTPPYPLLRDNFGNPIPMPDYVFADANGNPLQLPLAIPPGVMQDIFVEFRPLRPNHYRAARARAFLQTNGENFFGLDTDNNSIVGALHLELVGSGLGSALTNSTGDALPDAMIFPSTQVRETSTLTGMIYNHGDCDLRINSDKFRIVSGDVDEFEITSAFANVPMDANGNYVIPPGGNAGFDVNFTPVRSGSRRASVQFVSNDSTVMIPGVTERGTYYLNLFGRGKFGLEGRDVQLPPAVIDGDRSSGVAVLENNSGALVDIINVQIVGSTEIVEDPGNGWPTLPVTVAPSQQLELGLALVPTTGSTPGDRTATLEVTLENGDVLMIDVTGLAGTRTLNVVPTSLFQKVQLPVGSLRRQFVVVANNGTLPVVLQSVGLGSSSTTPNDYSVRPLDRAVIQPGGAEFVEVTYAPAAVGVSSAVLEIVSNTTNGTPAGTHTVMLGGEGTSTAIGGGSRTGSGSTMPGDDPTAVRPSLATTGTRVMMADGTALWQSRPNPTTGKTEFRYHLPEVTHVTMKLYDSRGSVVKTLLNEEGITGENILTVNLKEIPSGRYYYTLQTASGAVTLALDLMK